MQLDAIAEAVKKVMAKEAEVDESGLRMAAHAAHRQGQKMFTFKGKTYPVTVQGENVGYGECMEEMDESLKIATKTGTKVLGHSYGNSAAAHRDQTKHSVDDVKEPTKKDIEKDSKLYVKDTGKKRNYKVHAGKFFSNMDSEKPTKGKESPRYKNEEVEIDEEGDCVTEPEAKNIAKKEVKGHEKKMHHKEGYDFASRLIDHAKFAEEVEEELNEVLSKDASAGDWIHDFVHSDNPKFKGKSKAERKKMALGAYYAKQNESFDDEHGTGEKHNDEKEDKALVKKMVKKSALRNEEIELDEAKETAADADANRVTTDMLRGREEGGKSNSFKSFKLKLKSDGEMKAPAMKQPEETTARKSVKPGDAHYEVKPQTIHAKEEVELDEDTPKKGQDVSDKSWLKNAGKKPSKLRTAKSDLKNLGRFLTGKKETNEEVDLEEAVSRKDFQMVADLIKTHDDHGKRKELAQHHAEIFHRQNPRFDRSKFMKAANVNEAKTLSPGQDDAPFDPPYTTNEPKNVKDKSGAIHTPMSRAKDLARKAMKRVKTEMLGKAPGNN